MPQAALLITVRLPGGRYHGLPEWPPSPFRVFQALLAGAVLGQPNGRSDELRAAFEWLEDLPAPSIAAPPQVPGKQHIVYMPNNDLDTVGGDPRNTAKIRGATKKIEPRLLHHDAALTYCWHFDGDEKRHAEQIVELANRLYRLGHGVDMAYASGQVLASESAEKQIAATGVTIYTPSRGGRPSMRLRAPAAGSFQSLVNRNQAQLMRLRGGNLRQAPPPTYEALPYQAQANRLLFDLVETDGGTSRFHPIPITRAAWLVRQIRDHLARLLAPSFGEPLVERIVMGRQAGQADKTRRIQIIPLPSIGFNYADRAIRRVLIVIPPDCPIPVSEIEWAAGTVHLGVSAEGEIVDANQPQLVRATDTKMPTHYGVDDSGEPTATVWRTVTPVVLPARSLRGRTRSNNRVQREAQAGNMVRRALRHAGISAPVSGIRVQGESFKARNIMADRFELPDRLTGSDAYHVEINFAERVAGPVVVGNGRYMGLGLCAPAKEVRPSAFIFELPAATRFENDQHNQLARAIRRALMALSADNKGKVPRLFSGHEPNGSPSSRGRHEHVFIAPDDSDGDGRLNRILVIAPWLGDRTFKPRPHQHDLFDRLVPTLKWLGGKGIGDIRLPRPQEPRDDDPYFQAAKTWESETSYLPTKHPKRPDAEQQIEQDATMECLRRGLPRPAVEVLEWRTGPNGGNVSARIRLHFSIAVSGPILLGRGSHSGKGLFKGTLPEATSV